MKLETLYELLNFSPDKTEIYTSDGILIGTYDGKEFFWIKRNIQELEVKIKKIYRTHKHVVLEVNNDFN